MDLVIDCETNTYSEGNPYDSRGSLVSVHAYYEGTKKSFTPNQLEDVRALLQTVSQVIFFNAKFDLGWLRRVGLVIDKPLHDVQLAHFMLRYQREPRVSLNSVLEYYGLPPKLDVVEKEYWDKGIQTDQVPWNILCEYGEADCEKTYQCFVRQLEEFKQRQQLYKTFKVACQDTYVLLDMEWNGLKYNKEKCEQKYNEVQQQIDKIVSELSSVYPGVPINFGSNDQLSAYLYGGTIKETIKEHVGFFKTGQKVGQPRYSNKIIEHVLPRQFTPIKGSEMAKDGVFATDEATLRKLRGSNQATGFRDKLLLLAKLQKLNDTYYGKLPRLTEEYHWEYGTLHPNYNQSRVATGRLSSNNPNGQNLSGDILEIFESRYDD